MPPTQASQRTPATPTYREADCASGSRAGVGKGGRRLRDKGGRRLRDTRQTARHKAGCMQPAVTSVPHVTLHAGVSHVILPTPVPSLTPAPMATGECTQT
jgi:hypothetical protein